MTSGFSVEKIKKWCEQGFVPEREVEERKAADQFFSFTPTFVVCNTILH
jgi:hypothetical protein